ncbi:hypothetical protein F4802DRAFT_591123 [Xylaria palmicola]|nr:hypothetical protein F4802DRAFT_591123 [Xylaria palmicola]
MRFWHDSWPVRLVRAYMSLMQGRSTWNDAACLVKRESKHIGHYRLDIALESEVPLDDISSMPLLRPVVLRDTTLKETIEEIAQRLLSALFYFELTSLPTPVDSGYHVEGQNSQLGYDRHGNIVVPLVFLADQSFSLEVQQAGSSSSFPLSGSPYDTSALVSRGGLAAYFGTRSQKRKASCDPYERLSRRRRLF